jgi:hypothetical protein
MGVGDLQIHANEVKHCRGCHTRVVWVKDAYNKYILFDVPDSERGKSWLSIDTKRRHDCPKKELLRKIGRPVVGR